MVQDSVREELQTKIGRVSKPLDHQALPLFAEHRKPDPAPVAEPIVAAVPNDPPAPRRRQPRAEATDRIPKNTSQTLVEFQNRNSTVPDWRLHLQNSVRQRQVEAPEADVIAYQAHLVTNGSAAVKAQYIPEPVAPVHANPKVASALQRIEASRKRFAGSEARDVEESLPKPATKNYPFNVVTGSGDIAIAPPQAPRPATVNGTPKPRLVTSAEAELKRYDTNKLPPMPVIESASPIAEHADPRSSELGEVNEEPVVQRRLITLEEQELDSLIDREVIEAADEEIDDLATISARFTAGVFDVIVGGFATAIVMSPFLMNGGNWLSISGMLALFAAFGIVMFVYCTIGLGLRGRTLGMKILSLEVIDAEENEYPTFHQAAVSTAVYLLSLPLLGIGFVPAFFNEERRAAHDLVSGTLLVREV